MTECATLFDMAVKVTIEAIRGELKAGKLDERRLDQIQTALMRPARDKNAVFQSLFERTEKACRFSLADPVRANILGRLLIAPIEPILCRNGGFVEDSQIESFLLFAQFILGEEDYERYEQSATMHFSHAVSQRGGEFSWEQFYKSDDTVRVITPVYARFIEYFSKLDTRIGVFCDFLRRDLTGKIDAHRFTEKNGVHFLRVFFSDYIRDDFLVRSNAEERLDEAGRKNLHALSHQMRLSVNAGRFAATL